MPSIPNEKDENKQETESILDYPDSHLVESGNRHLSQEDDFRNMTVINTDGASNGAYLADLSKDPWEAPELSQYFENTWDTKTRKERIISTLWIIFKILVVFVLLYIFVCSLDLMSISLRLIATKPAREFLESSTMIKNPISGIMIGVFFTVIVQSSSTATSVVVSMVAAGLFEVRHAIPFIMGANIGTSITNSFVALTQASDRVQFRRAFAGATIHDMFNVLTTIVLMTLEVSTRYLERLTGEMVKGRESNSDLKFDFLQKLTGPPVHSILRIDRSIEECVLIKNATGCEGKSNASSLIDRKKTHAFQTTTLEDEAVGGIMFFVCIVIISVVLISMVKILNSILKGQIAKMVKKVTNTKIPYCPCATGYVALAIGAIMTFISQSSSVFTSALTPLVGIGVVSLEVMYPLTLGSNVGTTGTAIIAAFAVDSGGSSRVKSKFTSSLQIALCHLFFNISGILIFYPIPFMRWPIYFAKKLGKTTSKYRWVAILYIVGTFILLPALLLALSFLGFIVVITVIILLILTFAFIAITNALQEYRPEYLPKMLQTWNCLPIYLRSFEPYDEIISKCKCCKNPPIIPDEASRQTSQVTVQGKMNDFGAAPQPSNISLVSFAMGEEGDKKQSSKP